MYRTSSGRLHADHHDVAVERHLKQKRKEDRRARRARRRAQVRKLLIWLYGFDR